MVLGFLRLGFIAFVINLDLLGGCNMLLFKELVLVGCLGTKKKGFILIL